MERTLSPLTEKKLTRAIEKAASLALVQNDADRSKLLAGILLADDIENGLAKTAAAAFNRRLTVLRFQKTADEHKAETFELADPDAVHALMGGAQPLDKAASEQPIGEFEMELVIQSAPMAKAASATPVRPPLEDTMDYAHYEKVIDFILHKHAAEYSRRMGELYRKSEMLDAERADVLRALSKCASFEWRTLCNVFGDRLEDALGEFLPQDTDFGKTASALNPHTPIFEKVAAFLDHVDEYVALNDMLVDYKKALEEYGGTAAAVADNLRKQASISGTMGMLIRGGTGVTMAGINAAEAVRRATNAALAQGYRNAAALNRAGTDIDISPAAVLGSDFLIKDRYRDRLRAWSDLSADPVLAQYDPMELFTTAQKAMDTIPALERPDHREELRTYVSQLMPQKGRVSMADMAALSTIEKGLAGAPRSLTSEALAAAKELDKVKAPEAPETTSVFEMVNEPKLNVKDWMSEATTENIRAEKEDKDRAKEKADAKAKREEEAKKQDKEQKEAIVDFMNTMHIKPMLGQNNTVTFVQTTGGKNPQMVKNLEPYEVRALYEDYKKKSAQI